MTFIGADALLPNLLEHIQAFLADKAYAVTALLRQPERDSHRINPARFWWMWRVSCAPR